MPGRLGPRFAIEALFLVALALGAAFADLDARWIALIMAAGWLVVALLELTAERIWAAVPPWRRPNYYAVAAAPPPRAEAPEPEPEPEAEPVPEQEEATVIAPPVQVPPPAPVAPTPVVEAQLEPNPEPEPEAAEPEPEPEAAEPVAAEPARPTLEPLQPRPRRRWFRRGERDDSQPTPVLDAPKHVRLLPVPARPDPAEQVEREERAGQ